ncbi:TPA: hypothetical protein MIW32_002364 [Clostridioides difficile]|nr:hypothetical protein [Clostridioides difficile]
MENNKCREDFRFTQEYEEDYPNTNERYYENYQVADRYYNYPNKYKEPKMKQCCCKKSMREALELLRYDALRPFVNFNQFAFISDFFIVGAYLVGIDYSIPPKDNLSGLNGIFERFSACNCDLIDISGQLYYPKPVPLTLGGLVTSIGTIPGVSELVALIEAAVPATIDLGAILNAILDDIIDYIISTVNPLTNVDLASLCSLKAVAFNVTPADYEDFVASLGYYLDKKHYKECNCNCDCDDCCCNKGILDNLYMSNINNQVTVVAGSLVLTGVEVLGKKNDVLVLGNSNDSRIYFVCVDSIDYIA